MYVPRPRRLSVPRLVREQILRHPELAVPVTLREARAIAARERVGIVVTPLPNRIRGRLTRVGERVWIHVGRHVPKGEWHIVLMHELAHLWRDDPGIMCAYSDDETVNAMEEFCDVFAWAVTSPAREYALGREAF